MAKWTYESAIKRLLAHEGGYSNHPADPGGPTKFGITIATYRRYAKPGATAADVKAMKLSEAKAIYRAKYWDSQRCDELPSGVDYAVFDYGVNSGIGRSAKVLQRIIGAKADGEIGPETLKAVSKWKPSDLINEICDERLAFMKRLKTWPVFGKGWGRRVAEVHSISIAMAEKPASIPEASKGTGVGKAPKDAPPLKNTSAGGAAGAAVAAVVATGGGLETWQIAALAMAAFVAVALAIHFIGKRD